MKPAGPFLLVKRFMVLFGFWLVLTRASIDGIPFGLAAAAGGAVLGHGLARGRSRIRLSRLPMLAPGFLHRSLIGGLDVAWRAFHPKLPIRPGWLTYRSAMPEGAPRVVLSGEVTMMPGSLVAGSRRGELLVHALDTGMPIARTIRIEEERLGSAVER